jgi:hypothetical protein
MNKAFLQDLFAFFPGLWIRIRIGSGFSDFVDPDPEAQQLRNFSGKMHLLVIKKKTNFTTKKV